MAGRCARNECLRVLRQAAGVSAAGSGDGLDGGSDDSDDDDVALRLLLDERNAELGRAVDALPHQCSFLLRVLVSDPRPTYEEVAAALDMPIDSIGPTRQRCLERLRHRPELIGITEGSDRLLIVTTKGESG